MSNQKRANLLERASPVLAGRNCRSRNSERLSLFERVIGNDIHGMKAVQIDKTSIIFEKHVEIAGESPQGILCSGDAT